MDTNGCIEIIRFQRELIGTLGILDISGCEQVLLDTVFSSSRNYLVEIVLVSLLSVVSSLKCFIRHVSSDVEDFELAPVAMWGQLFLYYLFRGLLLLFLLSFLLDRFIGLC